MTTPTPTLPRRRRGVAFFEPILDESDSSSSSSTETLVPEPSTSKSTKTALFLALPVLLFVVWLLVPSQQPQIPTPTPSSLQTETTSPPPPALPTTNTTILSPFLTALSNLAPLSPALSFSGLSTTILVRDLPSSVSADLKALIQQTKTLVEEFSGVEHGFHSQVDEMLDGFLDIEEFEEDGMREGYASFYRATEGEVRVLVKRSGELVVVLGRLRGAFEREDVVGGERLGKIVEWLALVFNQADAGFKEVLAEATKGREVVEGLQEGWMGEGLVEREVLEIEKFLEGERKMDEVVMEISRDYMEGEVEGFVEGKLEAAMAKGEVEWW